MFFSPAQDPRGAETPRFPRSHPPSRTYDFYPPTDFFTIDLPGRVFHRATFGSTMHGSGRTMSRAQAKRQVRGEQLQQQMSARGILVKAVSMSGLAEEAGMAYKDISEVVKTVEVAGITKKVAQLRPIGNIKG
jgi:hypothetical protein